MLKCFIVHRSVFPAPEKIQSGLGRTMKRLNVQNFVSLLEGHFYASETNITSVSVTSRDQILPVEVKS